MNSLCCVIEGRAKPRALPFVARISTRVVDGEAIRESTSKTLHKVEHR